MNNLWRKTALSTVGLLAGCTVSGLLAYASIPYHLGVSYTDDYYWSDGRGGGIAYNGHFYLYSPSTGIFYKSTDAATWEKVDGTLNNPTGDFPWGVSVKQLLWNGRQFVLLTDHECMISTDGQIWNYVEMPKATASGMEFLFSDMVYANHKYVVVGVERNAQDPFATPLREQSWSSTDLVHFKAGSMHSMVRDSHGSDQDLLALASNGHTYISTGLQSATSQDGVNWYGHKMYSGSSRAIWDGHKYWIAMDTSIQWSTDGLHWHTTYQFKFPTWNSKSESFNNNGIPMQLSAIGFNGKEYGASGFRAYQTVSTLTYFTSKDGVHWKVNTIPHANADVAEILPYKSGFIFVGNKVWTVTG